MKNKLISDDKSFFIEQQKLIAVKYPLLHFKVGSNEIYLAGKLCFNAEYDNVQIEDSYHIKILFPRGYPQKLPFVWETKNRIPPNFHKLKNDALCLGTAADLSSRLNQNKALIDFIERIVVKYLFGFSYFEKSGKLPWEEWTHGTPGIIEYYKNLLNLESTETILTVLNAFANGSINGHRLCPCGSGIRYRACHQKDFSILKNIEKIYLESDIREIRAYISQSVNNLYSI